ncbi:MAG: winged helix-turn-helix domain-containing protein [Candidatus Marinimicrobia bacterium]|nr:winged helix-turn-helix domain-containing protein [Candidatus Neomarinimicrobiota bacterium]
MIENNPRNVSSGFEMLLEEVEAEIDFFTRIGSRAFESRDFCKVDEARTQAEKVTAFRDKVATLRKEWDAISGTETEEDEETRAERRNLGRLRKGLRTPEAAYYQPILKALIELGGSAKMQAVLDKVHKAMRPILKDVDHEPLASDPDMPRWRNSAQWARNTMRQDGLLKADSPHGTWEISDAGRAHMERHA